MRDLRFSYREREVLHGISFDVAPGSFVGIGGTNGSGKTTLLRLIQGLAKPSQGAIYLNEKLLHSWSRKQLAQQVAAVCQRAQVSFDFAARQLVLLGRTPYLGFLNWPTRLDEQVVDAAMRKTDCFHVSQRLLSELSAGEFQRVQIAAALAQEPLWMLLDEPTTYLDPKQKSRLLFLLRSLQLEGVAILCVSHDLHLLRAYADQVLLLDEGRQIDFGDPEKVLSPRNLQEIFEMSSSS